MGLVNIYKDQTSLQIRLTIGENLSVTTRVLIKYRKPNGLEGWYPATILDEATGVVAFDVVCGLNDVGFWTTWAYVYYEDGTVAPGDPTEFGVYKEGKKYVAFPYGEISAATEVTEMAQEAFEITYDNDNSTLIATNVQDAIDEEDAKVENFSTPISSDIIYDNSSSGLEATDVKAALDEIDSDVAGIELLISQANQIIYVDNSRTDSYIEDGTINKPYKTLAGAVAVAGDKAVIRVSAGTYTENIALAGNVNLIGMGIGKTILTGSITTGTTGNCSLKELSAQGVVNIQCDTVVTNVKSIASVNISSNVKAYNFDIASTVAHALSVTSGLVIIENSAISTTDNASAIVQNGGNLVLENIEADNNAASNATVDSSGGSIRILFSTLINSGAGLAADLENGAVSGTPNILMNVRHSGGISTGTAYTIQEGIEGIDPTGTNFSKRPATQIGFDNTETGLVATEVQAAVDEGFSSIKSGTGSDPSYSPTNTPELFYRLDTNTLWIHNGTAWKSVTLT